MHKRLNDTQHVSSFHLLLKSDIHYSSNLEIFFLIIVIYRHLTLLKIAIQMAAYMFNIAAQ